MALNPSPNFQNQDNLPVINLAGEDTASGTAVMKEGDTYPDQFFDVTPEISGMACDLLDPDTLAVAKTLTFDPPSNNVIRLVGFSVDLSPKTYVGDLVITLIDGSVVTPYNVIFPVIKKFTTIVAP